MKNSTRERLLPGADAVVRRVLPILLDSHGLSDSAESLRGLPALQDVGSVTFAVAAVSRAAEQVGAGDAEAGMAVRLCGEAVMAAMAGDAKKFTLHVKAAARSLQKASSGQRALN